MTRRLLTLLLCCLLACVLGGCGSALGAIKGWVGLDSQPKAALRKLRLVSDVDANGNSASRVDVVAIYSNGALSMLPATAQEWFAQRRALQAGLGTAIEVSSFELPPATLIEHAAMPPHVSHALAVRAYIDLQVDGGQHYLDISAHKAATLQVANHDVVYQPET